MKISSQILPLGNQQPHDVCRFRVRRFIYSETVRSSCAEVYQNCAYGLSGVELVNDDQNATPFLSRAVRECFRPTVIPIHDYVDEKNRSNK